MTKFTVLANSGVAVLASNITEIRASYYTTENPKVVFPNTPAEDFLLNKNNQLFMSVNVMLAGQKTPVVAEEGVLIGEITGPDAVFNISQNFTSIMEEMKTENADRAKKLQLRFKNYNKALEVQSAALNGMRGPDYFDQLTGQRVEGKPVVWTDEEQRKQEQRIAAIRNAFESADEEGSDPDVTEVELSELSPEMQAKAVEAFRAYVAANF